jgi:hypothetical protein
MNVLTQRHLNTTQKFPRKHGRTYMLRLAAEMFKNMDTVKLNYAHGASALHCEVVNPHDGNVYEVVIIPPGEHSHQHHLQKEQNYGNETNIRGANRLAEKAAAF